MLAEGGVEIDVGRFQNDMVSLHFKDDVLTLLTHLGYLTYKVKTNHVSIPNREVLMEWGNAVDSIGI